MSYPSIESYDLEAIVPAAGLSSRMTIFKPTLPLNSNSVIQNTILSLKQAGIKNITVVTGFRSSELIRHLRPYRVTIRKNYSYKTSDMFSSVKLGIEQTKDKRDAFLILPADIPLIRPSTISGLVQAFKDNTKPVLVPRFNGQAGHPLIMSVSLRDSLMNWEGDYGLRGWLSRLKGRVGYVSVPDRAITLDLDTPNQYRYALEMLPNRHIPDTQECKTLLNDVLSLDRDIVRHSETVAFLACYLAGIVLNKSKKNNISGYKISIDVQLLAASCLLHDICKGLPDHGGQAAVYLKGLEFYEVAEVVATHMHYQASPGLLNEKALLYWADKMVQGTSFIDPSIRFSRKLKEYPHARENILYRYQQVKRIESMFEEISGLSVKQVINKNIENYATTLSTETWQDLFVSYPATFYWTNRYCPKRGGNRVGQAMGKDTEANEHRYSHYQSVTTVSADSRYHLP